MDCLEIIQSGATEESTGTNGNLNENQKDKGLHGTPGWRDDRPMHPHSKRDTLNTST